MPERADYSDVAVIIPARFKSSRYPGKPIVPLLGRPLVVHVWDRCVDAVGVENTYIATDSQEIADVCSAEGMQVLMTSDTCLTGTDRVYEASRQLGDKIIVNVQGDEPTVRPADIHKVIDTYRALGGTVTVNGMCPIVSEDEFRSMTAPKVVAAMDGRLLYMSRAGIPTSKTGGFYFGMKQVCIYAFSPDALKAFSARDSKTKLEEVEDIEVLRLLEMGFEVRMVELEGGSVAVDIPEDVARAEQALRDLKAKGEI